MASLAFYLSASVLFAQSTVAFNCSKKPIYVDIHKRAVEDSSVFQYGSFIGVGTPAQNHSLWPSLAQNHTSFASHAYCGDNSTLRNCEKSTGGFFSHEDSTSYEDLANFQSLDKSTESSLEGFFGQDTLRLYTHYFETDGASQTLVENSTIEVAEQGSIVPGRVGVGSSSTLLRDLEARDIIAGKTYSLYIGHGYERAGGVINGSNVFGGYDSGRFTGTPHQYAMNTANPNPMSVNIKDILLTTTHSNTNISLFDPSVFPAMKSRPSTFEAQLTTEQFPLSLPYQITQNFISHLSAQEDNTWGDASLKLPSPFQGTLSIVLDDGYTITLPQEVLTNASNITPIQQRDAKSTAPFLLGSAFLAQIYLMADYEAHTFFLADAVQTNNAVMPVTFCPRTTPAAYQRPSRNDWLQQGLVGAVLGGVFGGIFLLAVAYCGYVAWMRRQDKRRLTRELERGARAKMQALEVEEAPAFDPPPRSVAGGGGGAFWKKNGFA
ncbi:acid protease [Dothidotthia symphoricarpi CBS 119687]|uniref:Acid protease n=1 Tax=Dothidotthia symphoricarpi CBS 119687 TaxID=1392245 RepID=A0A6A6A151_9PLEO|nr:acid protease [Dothidotthia symphoricarpi CBS 119687]KAF2125550.1 acid protease [Dothidotthia symphoricarpi CBS 119687]